MHILQPLFKVSTNQQTGIRGSNPICPRYYTSMINIEQTWTQMKTDDLAGRPAGYPAFIYFRYSSKLLAGYPAQSGTTLVKFVIFGLMLTWRMGMFLGSRSGFGKTENKCRHHSSHPKFSKIYRFFKIRVPWIMGSPDQTI